MSSLFKFGDFTLSSGRKTKFKIDCDFLIDEDIETIAYLISERFLFQKVLGVPTGGLRLEKALKKYEQPHLPDTHALRILLVDDVMTTGDSMIEMKKQCGYDNIMGAVIFRRGNLESHPLWIESIFEMSDDLG